MALGIIPAYAGSTLGCHFLCSRKKGSSPHTRGARTATSSPTRASGDHPRIRGEHNQLHKQRYTEKGIIPAYAGSTCMSRIGGIRKPGSSPHTRGAPPPPRPPAGAGRDHPRIRGEHVLAGALAVHLLRIIPAYAGSTAYSAAFLALPVGSSPHTRGAPSLSCPESRRTRDHPRIRGEHLYVAYRWYTQTGIIPAYAGSTQSDSSVRVLSAGSSPHTRGAHGVPALPRRIGGIIPAYAGSTVAMASCVT